jgi:eukaryotic-like serine/threonine-protein kinase
VRGTLELRESHAYLLVVTEVVGPYRLLGPLGSGGMGAVHKAMHEQTGEVVALKVAHDERMAIECVRREVRLLSRIRHPGVATMITHDVHALRPWYAMELVEGKTLTDQITAFWHQRADTVATGAVSPREQHDENPETLPMRRHTAPPQLTRPLDRITEDLAPDWDARPLAAGGALKEALSVFVSLCETLAYLHGEGVVHLDLKPSNILLTATGMPIVVDFGITRQVAGGLNRDVLSVDVMEGGTEHYMAPEQIVAGNTDARTDLYSLGCMLYEALTGRPPFLRTPTMTIAERHLHSRPLPPSARVRGLPAEIDAAVLLLLSKSPDHRIGYASDVQAILLGADPSLQRAAPSRKAKSYLYRSPLVARESLLIELRRELERARQGAGRCVVLAGPSGAGKTRLATEFAKEAHNRELMVISGECAAANLSIHGTAAGGRPLHPFDAVLRVVIDQCRSGGEDVTTSLVGETLPWLQQLEPTLGTLPGWERCATTLDDSGEAQGRVEQALVNTIVALSKRQPLLLIMDDVQWADPMSLTVMRALATINNAHVCTLLTCRSDDASSAYDSLSRIPGLVRYELPPLAVKDVGALIGGMLGREDPPDHLVELVAKRSGGNPFFVAEYLQVAVEAGHLNRDDVGKWVIKRTDEATLPAKHADLLSTRLRGASDQEQQIVEAAAVLGRSFSRVQLADVALSQPSQDMAIENLQQKRIFMEEGVEELRFTHDRLREAIYAAIGDDRRRLLHQRVAASIQLQSPQAATQRLEQQQRLAHHHRAAGNNTAAVRHALAAAELAFGCRSHLQGAGLLKGALELDEQHPQASTLSTTQRAELWGKCGTILENAGDLSAAVPALEKALGLLGHSVPTDGWKLGPFTIGQLWRRAWQTTWPSSWVRMKAGAARVATSTAAELSSVLARGYVGSNHQGGVLAAALLSANLAQRSDDAHAVVHSHAFLAGIAGFVGMERTSARYFEEARAASIRDGTLEAAATLAQIEGFYHLTAARWSQATAVLMPVLERSIASSALHLAEPALITLNYVHFMQGELAPADGYTRRLLQIGKETGNPRFQLIGELSLSLHDLYRGKFGAAMARLDDVHDRMLAFDELIHVANYHATRSIMLSQLGRHDEAIVVADRAAAVLEKTGTRNALLYNVHAFTPDVYLRAWSQSLSAGTVPMSMQVRASKAVAAAKQFAAMCPYAQPMALRFDGELHLLKGANSKATTQLDHSVVIAASHHNRYEEALASLTLSTLVADADRARHRERSRSLFGELGRSLLPEHT